MGFGTTAHNLRAQLPVFVALAISLTGTAPCLAVDLLVTTSADSGAGSLREAITNANAGDRIIFDATLVGGDTITLSSMLPIIDKDLTITGENNPNLVIDGNNTHRPFFVHQGTVTIANLTVVNGTAQGGNGGASGGGDNSGGEGGTGGGGLGAGGAVFVNATANVTLDGVRFDSNSARGGNAGVGGGNGYGGGGGGGLHGNGGESTNSGAAGGGGWSGSGGSASWNAGAGGGGQTANGGNTASSTGGAGGGAEGGAGGDVFQNGQNGAEFGGGGGAGANSLAGNGGDFGGGGGGGQGQQGGAGGFGGGGGGGGSPGTGGVGGFGAGDGGNQGEAGDGGDALGGAVFVRTGGSLTIVNSQFENGSLTAGSGQASGAVAGEGLYVMNGVSAVVDVGNGQTDTFIDPIAGEGGITKEGAGTLVLSGQNAYIGGTSINEGTVRLDASHRLADSGDVGVNNGATFDLNNFDESIGGLNGDGSVALGSGNLTVTGGTFSGAISGFGGVTKTDSGVLNLGGTHTYNGATTVNAGRLNVNGVLLDSAVTVDSGAIVGGNGTINTDLINQGTVAPGNSIGILEVNGTYTQSSAATLEIEITDTSTLPGTTHDWLNASNGGTVNLAGTVSVLAAPGNYVAGSQYTFIDAQTIYGTFDAITDDLAFFTVELGYTPTSVYFVLLANSTDFESHAVTGNQFALAKYIDDHSQLPSAALQVLLDDLQLMSTSQLQTTLQQLGGEIYGSTQQLGIQNTTLILNTISQQLQPKSISGGANGNTWAIGDGGHELDNREIVQVSYQPDGAMQFNRRTPRTRNTWVVGYGLGGNADSDGIATGLDYGMGGAIVGFDTYWNRGHRIGLYGGYVGTGIDSNGGTARNEINSGQIGTYITGRNDIHYYTIISGLQFDGYDSIRQIDPGLAAQANYDGWQGFGYLERGLVLHRSDRWSCQPFAGLQYVHIRQNGFTETGDDEVNLSVDGLDDDSLRSLLGIRVQTIVPHRVNVTPEFRAAWVHEFLDTDSPVVGRLGSVGGAGFLVNGLDLGRDWALVGTGLSFNLGRGWSAYANYDAQVNEHQAFHIGSGSVQKTW